MGRRYDRAETMQLLLDAGVQVFAEAGIHGARVDRIAEIAGVSKGAIYTYFGGKEELFAACIRQVMTGMGEAVPIDASDIPGYAGRLFDYIAGHPVVPRLFEQEAMHFGEHITSVPDFDDRAGYHHRRAALIADALADGPDADADAIFLSIIAMVYWYVAAPQVVQMIFGSDLDHAATRYRAHLVDTVEGMIETRSRRSPAR